MDVYGRDAELSLLRALTAHLDRRSMIDVGAEQGSLAAAMLHAGVDTLHAFDPYPGNADALRARFASDTRVVVHEEAVSDGDGPAELHVASRPDGSPLPFGHTLLARDDTDEITWRRAVTVRRRSLGSLVGTGDIPKHVGILKIDNEGHELAAVHGMGALEAGVVIVEHWTDLPRGSGVCPWTTQEMATALGERGFNHFAFIVHRREFVTLKWDDGDMERGAAGSLVFLHDRLLAQAMLDVLDCVGQLAERAVHVGQGYMQAVDDRAALVDELKAAADDSAAVLVELKQAADERLALVDELKQAADERLALVDELKQAADERLALVEELHQTAAERLQALEAARAQLKTRCAELESLRAQNDAAVRRADR